MTFDEMLRGERVPFLGERIGRGFTLALGEGVEKKADDFAAEVASMTAGA